MVCVRRLILISLGIPHWYPTTSTSDTICEFQWCKRYGAWHLMYSHAKPKVTGSNTTQDSSKGVMAFTYLDHLQINFLDHNITPAFSRYIILLCLPPVFESQLWHIWRVFHLWLRFITFGGRSAHLAYLVHISGRKTPIIILSCQLIKIVVL